MNNEELNRAYNDNKKNVTIRELFSNYSEEYKPEEIDWGMPVGNEFKE